MKTIAIINDIHGNVEALKVILKRIDELKVDNVFISGDMIGIGPSHNEVLDLIKTIPNLEIVKGNHEDYYLKGFNNPGAALEEKFHNWVKVTMEPKHDEFLRKLEYIKYFQIENLKVALLHYPRLDDNSKFHTISKDKSYECLIEIFGKIDADICIYGHDHYPSIKIKEKALINVGTAGCSNINVGYTRFGLLTIDKDKFDIKVELLKYDIFKEIELLNDNVPDSELIKKIFYKI